MEYHLPPWEVVRVGDVSSPSVRERILSAALECFARDGFDRARVDEVARRAGVSKGAIYWHFPDKASLFKAVVERELGEVYGFLESAGGEGPGLLELWRARIEAVFEALEGFKDKFRLFYHFLAAALRDGELRSLFWQIEREELSRKRELLRRDLERAGFEVSEEELSGLTSAMNLIYQSVLLEVLLAEGSPQLLGNLKRSLFFVAELLASYVERAGGRCLA